MTRTRGKSGDVHTVKLALTFMFKLDFSNLVCHIIVLKAIIFYLIIKYVCFHQSKNVQFQKIFRYPSQERLTEIPRGLGRVQIKKIFCQRGMDIFWINWLSASFSLTVGNQILNDKCIAIQPLLGAVMVFTQMIYCH